MNRVQDLVAAVFCRTERRLRRAATLARLAELRRLERMNPEAISRLQTERLRTVVTLAAATRWGREALALAGAEPGDVRTPADLAALPVLTRETVQRRLGDLVDPAAPPETRIANRTGGSTGAPTAFFQDADYRSWNDAAAWLGDEWCGMRPGDRVAVLWGADVDAPAGSWGRLREWLENRVFANAFRLSAECLEGFARELVRRPPALLHSYVSPAAALARVCAERGVDPRPRALRTTAETLTPADRDVLSRAFAAPVFDLYGSRELGTVAHECEAHQGLHVFAPNHIVELLPVAGLGGGRVVVTCLTNGAMPFLRYDTGDLAEWAAGDCPCGRSWPRLRRVIGRVSDLLVAPSGRLIHGEFFTHLFYRVDGVRQFQVIQETRDRLRVRVAFADADPAARERTMRFLEERIRSDADPGFHLEFECPERIEPTASGKHRFTMSLLDGFPAR